MYNMFMTIIDLINYYLSVLKCTCMGSPHGQAAQSSYELVGRIPAGVRVAGRVCGRVWPRVWPRVAGPAAAARRPHATPPVCACRRPHAPSLCLAPRQTQTAQQDMFMQQYARW